MKERNSKKKMWLSLGLAGALTVGATLALFTDLTGTLTNTFNIYNGAGGQGIDITIKEHDVQDNVNNDGENDYLIDADDKWKEGVDQGLAGINYNDLISYQIVDKDPTVFVNEKSVESVIVLAVTGLDETNQTKIKPYATATDTGYNSTTGLSEAWTEIRVTGGTDGTRYFTYDYTSDNFNSLEEVKDGDKTYHLLPAIFKHLQVQDVSDLTTGDNNFGNITAKAAAAQIENLDEDQRNDAIIEALKQLGIDNPQLS